MRSRLFWEMWNLGGNVLTLAPGLVVCYDRNKITLDLLDKAGIEVHLRGSGAVARPWRRRCMSMPIIRRGPLILLSRCRRGCFD